MARFIYDEFARIKSQRRSNLIQAKRSYKQSQREVRYWSEEAEKLVAREKLRHQRESRARQEAEERAVLGGVTKQELMDEIDRRTPELAGIVAAYDAQQNALLQSQARHEAMVEQQKKKLALERKLEMLEALDRFPKAYNDAILTLNALLYSRSLKDPAPPRRSKRRRDDDEDAARTWSTEPRQKNGSTPNDRKRSKTTDASASPPSPNAGTLEEGWTRMAASLMTAAESALYPLDFFDSMPSGDFAMSTADLAMAVLGTTDSFTDASIKPKKQKKPRDARNIGGWISPRFSQELDRSWLSRTTQLRPVTVVPPGTVAKGSNTTSFDLKRWVPQVGDIVLYYPSAHKVSPCKCSRS
jgi:hypothetical protein